VRVVPVLGHHRPVSDAGGERPLDQALEICVYAPLGFALEMRSLFPRFVERGRSQIVLARLIGKYTVRHGSSLAEGVVSQAAGQAQGALRRVGLTGAPASGPATPAGAPGARPAGPEPGPAAAPSEPPLDPATLAIPDYDSLSASQVVPRLDGLTSDELEAVRTYEAGTRCRKTILNKIAQLQAV
jgi:hypothetical protein